MEGKKYINTLVKYKWQTGVYNIQEMTELVEKGVIDKQEFADITRLSYQGVNQPKINSELV